MHHPHDLTPEMLLNAYASGIFPMAEHQTDEELFWVDPKKRGIFPLAGFHISKSLAKQMRRDGHTVSINADFKGTVIACANRPETWINQTISTLYDQLHAAGYAHSVEVRDNDNTLIGGVFGITIGGAFFGESMFSTANNASKIALAYLIDRLISGGFTLFDTQFITDHLASLGAVEISRAAYREQLETAIHLPADFHRQGVVPTAQDVIQRSTQTS